MNVFKSRDFWIGVGAACVVLKFIAPKIPAVASVTSKIT